MSALGGGSPDRRDERSRGRRVLGWVFPVLLWALATGVFMGGPAWWADDYWHNLRDPLTGARPAIAATSSWPFWSLGLDRGFFIRPLYYQIVPSLTTLLWNVPWVAQLIQALAHGLVVWLMYRLMLALRLHPAAAALAALVFMVYSAHFEAVHWFAALPTTMACALTLGLMLLYVRWARGEVWRWAVVGMAGIAAAVCCLNEQPIAAVLALPMVYLAAVLTGPPAARSAGRHAVRALGPALVCGLIVIAYVLLLTRTAPAGHRGGAGSFIALADLGTRLDQFTTVLWRRMILKNFLPGALGMAVEQWGRTLAVVMVSAAGLAGVAWAALLGRGGNVAGRSEPSPSALASRHGPGLVVLAGLAIFVTGWALIVPFAGYEPDSRLRYWPSIGLAIAAAGVLTWIARWGKHVAPHSRGAGATVVRVAAALVCVPVLIAWASASAGAKIAMQRRFALDQEQAAQLRQLVPAPRAYSFFVPLRIETTGIRTGSPVFDAHFKSVWEFPWTTPRFIVGVYGREDVRAGCWRKWTAPDLERGVGGDPVRGASEEGLHYNDRLGPRFPRIDGAGWRVPWDVAVPFVVDREGRVRLVGEVEIPGPNAGDPPVVIAVPQGGGGVRVRLPRG